MERGMYNLCTVGVTGHRILEHEVKVIKSRMASVLDQLRAELVISGMAIGFDQLVCEVCVEKGIPFISAIPFDGQENAWVESDRTNFYELLLKAKEIKVVSEGGFAKWKYLVRNKWIVDNSNILVSYLPSFRDSGTKHCVDYAVKNKVRTINIGLDHPADTNSKILSYI
jgi:uncharacterized phage-like protein YoqJ